MKGGSLLRSWIDLLAEVYKEVALIGAFHMSSDQDGLITSVFGSRAGLDCLTSPDWLRRHDRH